MKLLIILCVLLHFNVVFTAFYDNDESEQNSPLHEAVLDDNYMNVKKLINKKANINEKNYFGETPLLHATERGYENIVKLLIEKDADVNIKDNYGKIPLFSAAQNGHFEIFELLVNVYKDKNITYTNITDTMGMSVLHFASMNRKPRNTEMLRNLLSENIDVNLIAKDNTTPLHYAASTGNSEMVCDLLEAGAKDSINLRDSVGNTPLIYAAFGTGDAIERRKVFENLTLNNAEVDIMNDLNETALFFVARSGGDNDGLAKLLIRKGARVDAVNIYSETLLHIAAKAGYVHIGEHLLSINPDLKNVQTAEGQTALHYAVKFGQDDFVDFLIGAGIDESIKDENQNTALQIATMEPLVHTRILELLSQDKNSIGKTNTDGKSLLHLCTEKGGDMKTFEWLLKKGANVNATDKDGCTILHSAAQYGRKDIVEWLFKHNSLNGIINKQDNYGNSPLHFAIGGSKKNAGSYEIAEILLSNKSNVNTMNFNFEYPIHAAARTGRKDIVNLLIKYDAMVNVRNRIDWTPLFDAVLSGSDEVVNILINHEDDFNMDDIDSTGKTVFHICGEKGSVPIGKILTSHGASVNAVDDRGRTALHGAAEKGNWEFIEWLINSQYVDDDHSGVNMIDGYGRTALHLAAKNGHEAVVKTLLAKDAEISKRDKFEHTPLALAVLKGRRNVAKIILRHSNQLDIKYGSNDRELILLAAERGYDDVVEMLLNRKANVKAEDPENWWTPLHYAANSTNNNNSCLNIVKILLSHVVKDMIEAKTKNNQTAIMLAIQNGNNQIVQELLNNGADIEAKDDNDRTLVEIAQLKHHQDTVEILTNHENWTKDQARIFHIFIFVIMCVLVPLVCFIMLFFHKLLHKDDKGPAGLKLTDLLERYMFPQNQTMLSSRIGKGAFGTVYKGWAHKILTHENETLVAIKIVTSDPKDTVGSQKMLLSLGNELKILMQCGGHINLVNLLGIVTENIANHEMMVIMEYCRHGCLKDVLEKHHKNIKNQNSDSNTIQMTRRTITGPATVSVTRNHLSSWSYQIAQGMNFLAMQRIVHGNLMARSIFLTDTNIVKISDFGLARAMYKTDAYIAEKEGKIDYKWLSIESMHNRVITTKSDVWSFGILLWEMYSFGETPYHEVESFQLKRHIQNGHILEKPPYANDNVYEIMRQCWRLNPESRPRFDSIEQWLMQLL